MKIRLDILTAFFSMSCVFILCKSQTKDFSIHKTRANLSDSALLDIVERGTFRYFWGGAEPTSGMARERVNEDNDYPANDKMIVASGGSGFGIMAVLAAIHRNFISRDEGRERLEKIVHFLETADRFHGAWPHWWNGETGKVQPFGKIANGGHAGERS